MATTEERLKILKMIQNGKITAEDGATLLEALERRHSGPQVGFRPDVVSISRGKGPRFIRIKVTESATGKSRVNVRLPVSLVNAGLKMGARFGPEIQGLDVDQLKRLIDAGETGQVFDIIDDQDGERLEVFLE